MSNWPDVTTALLAFLAFVGTLLKGFFEMMKRQDITNLHLQNISKSMEKHEKVIEAHDDELGEHTTKIERHEVQLQNHHERIVRLEGKP